MSIAGAIPARAEAAAGPGPNRVAERDAWAVLTCVDRLGPVGFANLLTRFGSAAAVLDAARRPGGADRLVREVGRASAEMDPQPARQYRLDGDVAARIAAAAADSGPVLDRIQALDLAVLTLDDDEYPRLLLNLEMPPPVLFVRGSTAVLDAGTMVAVVGTRQPTEAGRHIAARISGAISRLGGVVVSGLAVGIDGAAHAAAVNERRPTVAVLGSGHGALYPRAHARLAEAIVAEGGTVVSELGPDVPGNRGTFPRRNRLISGLAASTIVVEAGLRSGALITAEWALEQGRECFIVPGPIDAATSAGCLQFLRSYHGQARVVAGVRDLLEDLGLFDATDGRAGAVAAPELGGLESQLADLLIGGAATADALVAATGLPVATVLSGLTLLEMRGMVSAAYGRYRAQGALLRRG
jgi:DNA processing protein